MIDNIIETLNDDFIHGDVGDLPATKVFHAVTETLIQIGFNKKDSVIAGFSTAIDRDVLPFFTVAGNRARAIGINKEGLKRRGYSAETIRALQDAFKQLIKSSCSHKVALEKVEEIANLDENVRMMLDFLVASERGWIR